MPGHFDSLEPITLVRACLGVSHSTLTGAFRTVRQLVAAQGASLLGAWGSE